PSWNAATTAEALLEAERSSFLEWRRSLVELEEVEGITMTPYERNLEFWRQLWRVIERSDVVVQIVDARNPLLFRCVDLECYVKEVDPRKENLLLVNKSDYLTESQREIWAQYFRKMSINAVFFSALSGEELDSVREEEKKRLQNENEKSDKESEDKKETDCISDSIEECATDLEKFSIHMENEGNSVGETEPDAAKYFVTSSRLLSRSELVKFFGTFYKEEKVLGKCVTIGLVGYPNVGKSSTINCLMSEKRVSVSATPGKTKHFQTLFLREDILLCDCPGLVFPAFVATKPEMIISGILPIDQVR
ncbi:large subunit GTPase 1, partial [Halocaridina rubra]